MAEQQETEWLLAGMQRVAHELAAGRTLEALLASAMSLLRELFGADRAAIFLGLPLRAAASFGLSKRYLEAVEARYLAAPGGAAQASGTPVFIPDVLAPGRPMGALHDAAEEEGYRSLLLAPMVYAGAPIGGFSFYYDRPVPRDENTLRLAALLADQLALAMEIARRQERLEAEQRRSAEILEQLPVGVLLARADGAVELANGRAREILEGNERVREILQGTQLLLDRSGRALPPGATPMHRALAGERLLAEELSVPLPAGGLLTYLISAVRLDGTACLVFQDVTREREADRLKDLFLEIVSHELRTPLTALRLYAHLLRKRLSPQGGEDARLVARLDEQLERLSRLIQRLLDAAALQHPADPQARVEVDLLEVVREEVFRVQPLLGERKLQLVAPEGVTLRGFREQIARAIRELLENARLHGRGAVKVTVGGDPRFATVVVRDEGPGVDAEELAHLFDRFSSARGALPAGGLGLGLFIVAAIARAHGGDIAYGRKAGGTRFRIRLARG